MATSAPRPRPTAPPAPVVPRPCYRRAATTSPANHVRDVDIWRVEVRDDVRDLVPEVDVGDVGEVDVGRTRLGSGSGPVCYPAGRPSPNRCRPSPSVSTLAAPCA